MAAHCEAPIAPIQPGPASRSRCPHSETTMPILLLVDDESSVRYTFQRLFSSDVIEVVTASTVAEGISLYRERRPDVVVLDLQLPDGSGLQVFEEVRKLNKKIPVIFITAHG